MKRLGLIALLLTLVSCAHSSTRVAADANCASGETGARATVSEFLAALNALDLDRFMNTFADDATGFLPLGLTSSARIDGKQALREAFSKFFTGSQSPNITPKELRFQMNGNTALATFDGGAGEMVSRRTLVLRCRSNVWEIVHLHASNLRRVAAGAAN